MTGSRQNGEKKPVRGLFETQTRNTLGASMKRLPLHAVEAFNLLEPPCGIEPQTYALRVRCSTS